MRQINSGINAMPLKKERHANIEKDVTHYLSHDDKLIDLLHESINVSAPQIKALFYYLFVLDTIEAPYNQLLDSNEISAYTFQIGQKKINVLAEDIASINKWAASDSNHLSFVEKWLAHALYHRMIVQYPAYRHITALKADIQRVVRRHLFDIEKSYQVFHLPVKQRLAHLLNEKEVAILKEQMALYFEFRIQSNMCYFQQRYIEHFIFFFFSQERYRELLRLYQQYIQENQIELAVQCLTKTMVQLEQYINQLADDKTLFLQRLVFKDPLLAQLHDRVMRDLVLLQKRKDPSFARVLAMSTEVFSCLAILENTPAPLTANLPKDYFQKIQTLSARCLDVANQRHPSSRSTEIMHLLVGSLLIATSTVLLVMSMGTLLPVSMGVLSMGVMLIFAGLTGVAGAASLTKGTHSFFAQRNALGADVYLQTGKILHKSTRVATR
jgi:hypothetical protein